ncbi:carbohydrate kinase family protein [Kingella oralis]|uniref:carbohydrate kinase family protein n=1 Tax=Kingella oralis TaxID=505 RepID=UPI0034E489E9
MPKITAFGEILWDNLPTGKVLGGAPVNLLTHLAALGADCSVISRCGNDADGAALREAIRRKHVAIDFIQTDPQLATSQVLVQLNDEGCAHYDIVYPCAWDKIQAGEAAKTRVAQSDVFIFGSLSVRDAVSRQALAELLPHASFKIFDVNLRPPHYRLAHLSDMMRQADFIKLNDDELHEIATALGSPYRSIEQNIRFIAEHTHTRQICVTLSKHGALYFCDGELFAHHGYRVTVADTVGAGDSFLAGFIHQYLQRKPPQEILAFACALGSLVASRHGATPEVSLAEIEAMMNPQ